jgi:bile acid:Na+ symporter, BASS family
MKLAELIRLALPLSIALTVFAFGLVARREDGWSLRRHRWLGLKSLLALDVVMPLLAVGIAAAARLEPSLEVALVALSVSPVSPLVPRKEVAAGGRDNYAVALLFGSALFAGPFLTLAIHLLGEAFEREVTVPLMVVLNTVLVTVLGPLIAAVVARALVPHDLLSRMAPAVRRVATVLLVLAFLPVALVAARDVPFLIGNGSLAAIGALVLGGLVAGHLLGGPARSDRTVLAFSTATRHPAVAIAIGTAAAPEEEHLTTAVILYVVVSSIASTLYVAWSERTKKHPRPRSSPIPLGAGNPTDSPGSLRPRKP